MKPKHIHFLSCINYAQWGGSEELWSQTAIALKNRGHKISASVGSLMTKSPNCINMTDKGISVLGRTPVRFQRAKNIIYNEILRQHLDFQRNALKRWLSKNPPDLIVINQPTNHDSSEWLEFLDALSIPYVIISHAATDSQWPSDYTASRLRKLYSKSLCNYFVSNHNHRLTEWQIGCPIQNFKIVFNPYKVTFFQEFKWVSENDIPRLGVVARIEPHSKGHDLLLLAIHELNKTEFQARFSIYGSGGNLDTIARMIQRLGLSNVSIEGYVNDIHKIWSNQEMLLLPSRSEGLPLSLVEAALCGRPAIVTDVGGNTELVEDGVTGYVIEAREVYAVVSCLKRAITDRKEWQNMGKEMMKKARSIIPKNPASDFSNILESVLLNL